MTIKKQIVRAIPSHKYHRVKQAYQRVGYFALKAVGLKPSVMIARYLGEYASLLALSQSDIAKPIGATPPAPVGQVLIYAGASGFLNLLTFELAMYRVLTQHGYQCHVVACDQSLDFCEMMDQSQSEEDRRHGCYRCWRRGRDAFHAVDIPYRPQSELLDVAEEQRLCEIEASIATQPMQVLETMVIDGINVGQHAVAAALRFLKRGTFKDINGNYESGSVEVLRHYIISAVRSMMMARAALQHFCPDIVLLTHGIYVSWGPAREVFEQAGIPVAVFDQSPVFNNAYVTSWNAPSQAQVMTEQFEAEQGMPLSPDEHHKLTVYLDSRRQNARDRTRFNVEPVLSRQQTRDKLGIPHDVLCVGLFSNLLWDAATVGTDLCFSDQVAWVRYTIDYFVAHPEKWLIIRPHPAEELRGTQQAISTMIEQIYPELPPNILVMRRSMDVNAYSVFNAIDAGLVNTSTVGLEMSLLGIPVVLVSTTHYRGKGFTLDPESPEAYKQFLDGLQFGRRLTNEQVSEAERYAYMFFFQHHLPLPFFEEVPASSVIQRAHLKTNDQQMMQNLELWVDSFIHRRNFVLPRNLNQ